MGQATAYFPIPDPWPLRSKAPLWECEFRTWASAADLDALHRTLGNVDRSVQMQADPVIQRGVPATYVVTVKAWASLRPQVEHEVQRWVAGHHDCIADGGI